MTRIKLVDFKAAFSGDQEMFKALAAVSHMSGNVVVTDDTKLGDAFKNRFAVWVEKNAEKVLATDQQVDELFEEEQTQARQVEFANECVAHFKKFWCGEHKPQLLPYKSNADCVGAEAKYLDEHETKVRTPQQLVDEAVARADKKGLLMWAAEEAPTPPPVAVVEPVEPPVILSDGSQQLSLDAPQHVLSRATVVQLRDYDRRKREQAAARVRSHNNIVFSEFAKANELSGV